MSVAGGTYGGATLTGNKKIVFRLAEGQTATFTRQLLLDSAQNVTIFGPVDTAPAYDQNGAFYGLKTDGCSSNLEFHDISGRTFGVSGSSDKIRIYGGSWGGYTVTPPPGDSVIAGNGAAGPSVCGDGGLVSDVLIDGVRFHDVLFTPSSTWGGAHPDCLESYGNTRNVTIRNSTFERCGNTFIGWYTDFGSNANLLVENNLFRDVTKDTYYALQIGQRDAFSCDVVFRYNTFDPNNPSAGYPHAPPLITCQTSQVYGNIFRAGPGSDCPGQWSYNVFETPGTACGGSARVVKDAFFLTRGSNYHLRPGSPAIGGGDPKRFPSQDADDQPRPVGGVPDAGFDESQGIVSLATGRLLENLGRRLATSAASTLAAGNANCLGRTSASGRLQATLANLASIDLAKERRAMDLCALVTAAAAGSTYLQSLRLREIAIGSQDRHFRSIAKPGTERSSTLRGITAHARALAAALNAENENLRAISGLLTAYRRSVARAQAAGDARDADWQDKQLAAARSFAKQGAARLSKEPALRAGVARALRRAGVPATGLTLAEASSIAGSPGNAVSAQARRALALLGLRPREISGLAGRTKQLRASELEGVSLTRSLLERGTVARLRAAAAALRRLGG